MNKEQRLSTLTYKNRIAAIVLLFALLVGLIYIYPDMEFVRSLKGGYQGIIMTATNDELKYLGQINAFYKGGNPTLSGFDNYEHKGEAWTFGFLPPLLLGALGKALAVSVTRLDLVMSFILPALLFVLIYILAFKINNSPVLSILSSFSVLLGYHLFSGKFNILNQVFKLKYSEPLWFLRPVSPQFNHILLILSLISIYIALGEKKRGALWVSGILIGSLFYTFFYYWTFIYAGLLVFLFIFLAKKDFGSIKSVLTIYLVSFMISIPYWINLWNLVHLKNYADFEYYINVLHTRNLILPVPQTLLAVFIIAAFYKKKKDFSFYYILAFLAGGILCINQQIVTNKLLFSGHWIGYSNKTFLIIALFASLKNFKDNFLFARLNKAGFVSRYASLCCVGLLVFSAFIQQDGYLNRNRPFYARKQHLSGALNWLKANTAKDDVVATDPFNNMKNALPEAEDALVYSHNFNFIPVSAGTLRSQEELEDRYLISLAILGYNQNEAREFIAYNNGIYFICLNASKKYGGKGPRPGYFDHLNDKYSGFLDNKMLLSMLKKYRLNYILVDNAAQAARKIKAVDVSKVYDDGKFTVYEVQRPKGQGFRASGTNPAPSVSGLKSGALGGGIK